MSNHVLFIWYCLDSVGAWMSFTQVTFPLNEVYSTSKTKTILPTFLYTPILFYRRLPPHEERWKGKKINKEKRERDGWRKVLPSSEKRNDLIDPPALYIYTYYLHSFWYIGFTWLLLPAKAGLVAVTSVFAVTLSAVLLLWLLPCWPAPPDCVAVLTSGMGGGNSTSTSSSSIVPTVCDRQERLRNNSRKHSVRGPSRREDQ